MDIVITGANRGIGLELTRQCLSRGDTVTATARNLEQAKDLQALKEKHRTLTVLACDVADDASVKTFARQVAGPIDTLINNAGVMGDRGSFEQFDLEAALATYSVNALGPLRVTRALLPQLRKGSTKKVLNVTSGMASIAENGSGGAYGYRMSKAALNMGTRSLAIDLAKEGFAIAVISPGWVKTDMGGQGASTDVDVSARGILAQLARLGPKTNGEFLDFADKRWAW
jgi:NAD(P)-dependent dehydrogenase (short-subunit alcohol dehydrogenase family)